MSLAGGVRGISDTLRYMAQAVDSYKTSPTIRELALRLTRDLPQKDYGGEVRQLFDYVQKRIRYVRDIHGVETIQTPVKTLEYGQGDCDDKATLLAAMLQSLGHKTRFHAVGVNGGPLCHVFVEVFANNKWIALETTEPVNIGWIPPNITSSVIEGDGDVLNALAGFLSDAWGAVKSVGRTFESQVIKKLPGHNAIDSVTNKVLGNKIVQGVASVVSFVPGPWDVVATGVVIAGKAQQLRAADSAARKLAAQAKAFHEQDVLAQQQLAATRYVVDADTGEIREATAQEVASATAA